MVEGIKTANSLSETGFKSETITVIATHKIPSICIYIKTLKYTRHILSVRALKTHFPNKCRTMNDGLTFGLEEYAIQVEKLSSLSA